MESVFSDGSWRCWLDGAEHVGAWQDMETEQICIAPLCPLL